MKFSQIYASGNSETKVMLIQFQVANYRSFKEPEIFSMVAAKISSKDKSIDVNNVINLSDNPDLLTSAAIYGANASGKSNLITAMRFMKTFVLNSLQDFQADEVIGVEPFRLSEETIDLPSSFEIVFILDDRRYRYGFEVDTEKVVSEWLYHVPSSRETRLFERNGENISISSAFREGKTELFALTRHNALFLSVVAQFNGELSRKILRWFRGLGISSGLNDRSYRLYTIQNLEKDRYRDEIIDFVRRLDLGISDIEIEHEITDYQQSLPGFGVEPRPITRSVVKTAHRKFDIEGKPSTIENFNLDLHESEGTRKLFAFAGPIIDTLQSGKILIVDELDARLHPLITCAIIDLFNSVRNNPHRAQLVFTTHDTNLLSNKLFRRDQIWFAEKDKKGATHLYSLVEFKVRNDASFEKDYVSGRYGAIPFIGDLSKVVETHTDEEGAEATDE